MKLIVILIIVILINFNEGTYTYTYLCANPVTYNILLHVIRTHPATGWQSCQGWIQTILKNNYNQSLTHNDVPIIIIMSLTSVYKGAASNDALVFPRIIFRASYTSRVWQNIFTNNINIPDETKAGNNHTAAVAPSCKCRGKRSTTWREVVHNQKNPQWPPQHCHSLCPLQYELISFMLFKGKLCHILSVKTSLKSYLFWLYPNSSQQQKNKQSYNNVMNTTWVS